MDLHAIQGTPLFTHLHQVPKQYPYLTHDLETEVIIIGGGITGAIVSYYFSKAGIPCMVLEKARIGFASTSGSTALLQYELDVTSGELMEYLSKEEIIEAYHLGIEALEEVKKMTQGYANYCGYEPKDTLLYTAKEEEIGCLEAEYEFRKSAHLPVKFIKKDNNPFSFKLEAGVYAIGGGAQIDPYMFTHHLLQASEQRGAAIYENTPVAKVYYESEGVIVETDYGYRVKGKKVILATGYDTNLFSDRSFGTKTVSYNVASKPVKSFDGWPDTPLIRDFNDPYYYYRTTSDGRIIAGGQDIPFDPNIFDDQAAYEKYDILEARMKDMFNEIKDIEIEYKYCGCFGSTTDNLGFMGPDPKHHQLWYCLGYGANGILFDVIGAKEMAELYQGKEANKLKLFKVDRFDGKPKKS